MKRVFYLLFAALALAACDEVDEGGRFVYVEPEAVGRAVLVEDFTGQKCVNCPNATDTILSLQRHFGEENVVAVAIHGGNFGYSEARGGLATDEAAAYYSRWNIEAQPAGIINRQGGIQAFEKWTTAVLQQIARPAHVGFERLHARFNDDSTRVLVDACLMATEPTEGKFQLWLTEDSIVAMQLLPDGSLSREYVHNHVFRRSINGTWGADVALTTGETQPQPVADVELDPKYNRRHLAVVAFVYNDKEGVLQAARTEVDPARH